MRQFDEKFRILQALRQFYSDLDATRETHALRQIDLLAVAFVDIDDFKNYNSTHTKLVVDRLVLPQFMRLVEAHMFERGYAYRQGGDEYLLFLRNAPHKEALDHCERLRGGQRPPFPVAERHADGFDRCRLGRAVLPFDGRRDSNQRRPCEARRKRSWTRPGCDV